MLSAELTLSVVDDDVLIQRTIGAALREQPIRIAAFTRSSDFLDSLDHLPPGVVLLDLMMPEPGGLAVQAEIVRRGAPQAVVFLSGGGAAAEIVAAVRAGAVDYLTKPFRRDDLLNALERANAKLVELLESQDRAKRLCAARALSERERQVLQGLADGGQTKTIAHDLGISARTVEMHRANIVEKLKISLPGALLLAHEAGIIRAA